MCRVNWCHRAVGLNPSDYIWLLNCLQSNHCCLNNFLVTFQHYNFLYQHIRYLLPSLYLLCVVWKRKKKTFWNPSWIKVVVTWNQKCTFTLLSVVEGRYDWFLRFFRLYVRWVKIMSIKESFVNCIQSLIVSYVLQCSLEKIDGRWIWKVFFVMIFTGKKLFESGDDRYIFH